MASMGSPASSGLLRPGFDVGTPTLRDGWRYEFNYWEQSWGEKATHLAASHDRSESYEMDRAHVFRLESGRYVLVTESGCSCYSADDANHDYYQSRRLAMEAYDRWMKK